MTAAGFRRIALGLQGAVEHAHHGHPDFRVGGRVFASLGYPDGKHGMIVLTPAQQRDVVRSNPGAFTPVKGKWGEGGCTLVRLDAVDEEALGDALTTAWKNAVAQGPTKVASARKRKTASAQPPTARKRPRRADSARRAEAAGAPPSPRPASPRR